MEDYNNLWQLACQHGVDILRFYVPHETCKMTDLKHLHGTTLDDNTRLADTAMLAKTLPNHEADVVYLQRILTDIAVLIDILHSQIPGATQDQSVSHLAASLFHTNLCRKSLGGATSRAL